ncbi:hypothetical protein [Helicobacter turcicus]|uniref:Uncharacterized protein n=1 Tax=Helicobacter turcicus TaxID=2867412 RepID=A0ABS7JPI6_9HELI|nr:hypothetical protein [Helicobacter turcicus]MBX7491321.1 hypothetical protein [Helicobacter turcicus]MBX7546192.1 hypothetical protein [Helicobacter turcicus]
MDMETNTRRVWLKGLKSEIMELRYQKLSDKEIKQKMHTAFRNYSTKIEIAVSWGFWIIVLALVGFGIHIGYAVLMWEAHLYEFSVHFSPYASMLIFVFLCVALCGILAFWLGYFVDFFRFHKILDDTLEEQFYLKLFKMFLVLSFLGFIVFMVMVFFVGLQISEFYGIPLGRSLFGTLMEIID